MSGRTAIRWVCWVTLIWAQAASLRAAEDGQTSPDEESAAGSATDGPAVDPPAEPRVRVSVTRPEMTAEARSEWADRLRKVYSQSPERWPAPMVNREVPWKELGLLPAVQHPESNPTSPEKVELGLLLFFEPRLSGSGQMACASCHDPELSWGDGRSTALGNHRRQLARNAPPILNAGFGRKLFWDGRAESLEDQARQVLANPDEMDSSETLVTERIAKLAAYREKFRQAFGEEQITIDRVTAAIACFERTLAGGRSRFDAFLRGQHAALADEAVIGLHLFRTEARCLNCHHGPSLSDEEFHDLGLSYYGRTLEDLGRYRVTKNPADVGRFKTPSLRNVANTGPYMHNGLFPLRGVLNLYNAGMPTLRRTEQQQDDPLFPVKSSLLQPLYLNGQDLTALQAFLESLSEPRHRLRGLRLPGEPEPQAVNAEANATAPDN